MIGIPWWAREEWALNCFAIGIESGFPRCCVTAFVWDLRPGQRGRVVGPPRLRTPADWRERLDPQACPYGYVPCQPCLDRLLADIDVSPQLVLFEGAP